MSGIPLWFWGALGGLLLGIVGFLILYPACDKGATKLVKRFVISVLAKLVLAAGGFWLGIKLFDLTGKAAIVTGGSKGLGQAMAAGLASAGADVLITSRHEDEAMETASEIAQQYGHRAVGMKADVSVARCRQGGDIENATMIRFPQHKITAGKWREAIVQLKRCG